MFESVAGAIFLDSNMSLDAVWKVYYRMMKSEIGTHYDAYSSMDVTLIFCKLLKTLGILDKSIMYFNGRIPEFSIFYARQEYWIVPSEKINVLGDNCLETLFQMLEVSKDQIYHTCVVLTSYFHYIILLI